MIKYLRCLTYRASQPAIDNDESYLPQPSKGRVKSFGKVPVDNGCEDLSHGVVIKRVNGYDIHVPSKSI